MERADAMIVDGHNWSQVDQFRNAARRRLIAARLALSADARTLATEQMTKDLDKVAEAHPGRIVSGYFPYRGEPDIRPWMTRMIERGVTICLPVVTERHHPLSFRPWTAESRMERGTLGILVPAEGPSIIPDTTIAPLVGFDLDGYRLGHGGGYFDRTLAALRERPILVVGIGYSFTQIATIHPQAHDIPMDRIVTENGMRGAR